MNTASNNPLDTGIATVSQERDRIALLKRKILLIAMPIGALASIGALLNLPNLAGATPIDFAAHAVLAVLLVGLSALTFFRPSTEFVCMVLCILSISVTFALRIALALYGPNSDMPLEQTFPPIWGFCPLIFVLTFVVAPRRTALLLSLGFYLTTALLVLVYLLTHLELFKSTPIMGVIAQQYIVAHGLYIALLYVVPLIQREYESSVVARENVQREREIEARDRAQRDRLDVALSASKMGLWELDVAKDSLVWDEGVYRLLGYTRLGLPNPRSNDLLSRVHPNDRSVLLSLLQDQDGNEEVRQEIDLKVRLLIPGQGTRVLASRGRIYRDAVGKPIRLAGVCWDMTEEESRRTELERSNQELREFAFVASHDLKEPLRGIRGFTELLALRLGSELDEESKDYVEYINDGVSRANALIEALLEYSRVGRHPLTMKALDMGALIEVVKRNLYAQIEESGAQVTASAMPRVVGDQHHLARLLQNLVSNAIHYAKPDEQPRILIKSHRSDEEWIFSVVDNGVGIADEHRERVFQIFQRLDKTRSDGTGIGLSVCKKIIERHEGRLWFESELGFGTTFSFTLPYCSAEVLESYQEADLK